MAPPRNRRPGFSRRAQYSLFIGYVIAVAGVIVAAILLAISTFDPAAFSALRAGTSEITAPISWGIGSIGRAIGSIPSGIASYFGVHSENARLKKQLADTEAVLLRARTLNQENQRLKHLLALREPRVDPIFTARLVSSTPSSTRRFAMLYAGIAQGVHAGMPVEGPDGLVGRVLEAGPDTARVLLLIDAESVVPIKRAKDGAAGFAAGRGDGLLDVRPIALGTVQFQPGDILVTSGVGGVYPPNVPVARVTRRERDAGLAEPLSQPDTLDFATVMRAYMAMPATPPPETRP
jgi:rod shape-determining protein MreC